MFSANNSCHEILNFSDNLNRFFQTFLALHIRENFRLVHHEINPCFAKNPEDRDSKISEILLMNVKPGYISDLCGVHGSE